MLHVFIYEYPNNNLQTCFPSASINLLHNPPLKYLDESTHFLITKVSRKFVEIVVEEMNLYACVAAQSMITFKQQ